MGLWGLGPHPGVPPLHPRIEGWWGCGGLAPTQGFHPCTPPSTTDQLLGKRKASKEENLVKIEGADGASPGSVPESVFPPLQVRLSLKFIYKI